MSLFSERRLLNVTQRELDARRVTAGQTTQPIVKATPTTIQQSAANQNVGQNALTIGSNPNADLVESLVQTNLNPMNTTPEQLAAQKAGMALADGANYVKGKTDMSGAKAAGEAAVKALQSTSQGGVADPVASAQVRADAEQTYIQTQAALMEQQRAKEELDRQRREDMAKPVDLSAAIDERRNARLGKLGIKEEDFAAVNDVLKQGGRISGEENGQTVFLMPDGTKRTLPMTSQDAKNAETVGKTDFAKEVQRNAPPPQETPGVTEGTEPTEEGTSEAPTTSIIASSAVDQTIATLQAMSQNLKGIDEQVFSAYLPSILARLTEVQTLKMEMAKMDTPEEQAALVEQNPVLQGAVSLADRREKQFDARIAEDKRILEENKRISLEANKLATESLELDKKMVEARQKEDETRQLAKNVEGEKQLRRSLNAAGVETSPLAIEYLQNKITEAADSLATMRETNNLTLLKFGIAQSSLATEVSSILNTFDSKRATLNSQYDDNIFNLDQFVSGARSSAYSEIQGKLKEMTEREDTLMREAGDRIGEARIKAMEMVEAEKVRLNEEEKQKKDDAWNMFKFSFDQSTDPVMRQKAIDAMAEAGYDVAGIDINSLPVSIQAQQAGFAQQERMAGIQFGYQTDLLQFKAIEDAEKAKAYDPFQYEEPEKRTAMSSANIVTSKAGMNDNVRAEHQAYVKKLLDNGDIQGANAYIVDLAEKQMNDGIRTTYNSQKTIMTSSQSLLSDLKTIQAKDPSKGEKLYKGIQALDRSDFNIYVKGLQKLRNAFGADKDPDLARVFARVENIASIIINQRYGAAVTDGEMDRATQYIAMSGNTLSDMIIKLEEMNTTFAMENGNLLSSYTGGTADYGAPYTGEMPTEDDFKEMENAGKVVPDPDGGGGTIDTSALPPRFGTLTTGFASGTVTGYGSDAWSYGLDLAPAPGTQFRTAIPARVEKVVYNPSWKGSPNSPHGMKQNGGFGNAVTVRYHDGVKIQVAHLNTVDVQEGTTVPAGAALGIVGNTGNTSGPTGIHFDITGYWPNGRLMTAKEVAAWMKQQSALASSSSRT